ncbi:hypothetical protein O1R50_25845 [Glycomyces luteolus]|uniref:Uncharacterized protein n=1 Tax=Glycomyces luteolus TaxID=2670330 RepID=A0A9X3PG22_9ACTN|nr:hypothetical protein [Glycomyces luteolus]MDA1363062.1 hypothetical protein [Glycomyces luteolus]
MVDSPLLKCPVAEDCSADEREAPDEILALAELADRRRHLYLLCSGD